MGFWSNLLNGGATRGVDFYTPRVTYLGADEITAMLNPGTLTAAQMWGSQPHFRTVVTFLARNIALRRGTVGATVWVSYCHGRIATLRDRDSVNA